MGKKLQRVHFKDRSIKVHNKYVFCAIIDSNNSMMINGVPDITEFFTYIDELSQYMSDFLIDEELYNAGYSKRLRSKFFKVASSELLEKTYRNTKRTNGKYPVSSEKTYLYQNMYHAIFNSEDFHNGVVWVFGTPETFNDFKGLMDEMFICKVNHDFNEYYVNAQLWPLDVSGECTQKIIPKSVQIVKDEIAQLNKKIEVSEEILSDHIKIVHSKKNVKKQLRERVNNNKLFDYEFLTYKL